MPEPPKAFIWLASRPETLEVAVERLGPEILGVIASLEILEAAELKRPEQKVKFVDMVV